MPKIEEVVSAASAAALSPLQKKVLKELEKRPGEVFAYNDPALGKIFPRYKATSLNWSVWDLNRKDVIGKLKVKGSRTYFGSLAAISELETRLNTNGRRG